SADNLPGAVGGGGSTGRGPTAVVEQYRNGRGAEHGDLGQLVTIELPHRHGEGTGASGELDGSPERAVTVAGQQGHRGGLKVGDENIGGTVVVEGRDGRGVVAHARVEVNGGSERAVAVAQQHRHVGAAEGGRHDIQRAVAAQAPHGHEPWKVGHVWIVA